MKGHWDPQPHFRSSRDHTRTWVHWTQILITALSIASFTYVLANSGHRTTKNSTDLFQTLPMTKLLKTWYPPILIEVDSAEFLDYEKVKRTWNSVSYWHKPWGNSTCIASVIEDDATIPERTIPGMLNHYAYGTFQVNIS
jgi:hypothetical protein